MQLKNNIPEIIERLERVKSALGGGPGNPPSIPDFSDAMFSALNTGNGLMKRRIFNLGEDAEGVKLGNYEGSKTRLTSRKLSIASDDEFVEKDRKKRKRVINRSIQSNSDNRYTEYEKYRLSHGRQIEYKDEQLTGALFNSIEVVRADDGKVLIAIRNPKTALIAGYQEQQIGNIRAGVNANKGNAAPAKIFTLSNAEYQQVQTEGNRLIKEVIINLFHQ